MWHESQPAGCCAAASVSSTSRRWKRSCSSRSSITSTRAGSRGAHRPTSPATSGSRVRRSSRHRLASAISVFSSRTNLAGRGARLGIGSVTHEHSHMSAQATCRRGRTCRITGTTSRWSTCRTIGLEGKDMCGGRSAGDRSRRLASSCAPDRHRSGIRESSSLISRIGQLAARCPSGEEAQRDLASGARQQLDRLDTACSRSCRLPAALADDVQRVDGRVSSLASGRGDGSLWLVASATTVRAREAAEQVSEQRASEPEQRAHLLPRVGVAVREEVDERVHSQPLGSGIGGGEGYRRGASCCPRHSALETASEAGASGG